MEKIIKKILNDIEEHGYVAYIVGGYVRDTLLGKQTYDIDICTNAIPKELLTIFNNVKVIDKYGSVKLDVDGYNIDITTFRKEGKYKKNNPIKISYINSLDEDILRRDFTINSLCMDCNGNIIDLVNGQSDLKNKVIKVVGNTKNKLSEDSTRVLRALRFMTVLDFKLDKEIVNYILNNPNIFNNISYEKRKSELDKIFSSKNVLKFLNFIKLNKLEKAIGINFNEVISTSTIIGIWAQLSFNKGYRFTKNELEQIKCIKEIVKKGNIDQYDIYTYGTYICEIAGEILKVSKKNIETIYNSLQIHSIKDIDITSDEICEILNITPSKKLGIIIKSIEKDLVYGKIINNKENIKLWLRNYKL